MDINERKQKLAEIKSSNELLEECKQKVIDNTKLDEKSKKDRVSQIDEAIKENYEKARLQYQATKKEVDSIIYNEVSEEYKDKYAKRLKAKGLTDEQLHQKEQAIATTAVGEDVPTTRKRHRRTKRTEQRDDEEGFDPNNIERLENEEELMKSSLVKTNKELERRRHHSTETISTSSKAKKSEEVIGTIIESKKISPRDEVSIFTNAEINTKTSTKESKRVLEKNGKENNEYSFDVSQIPPHVQYDILPLPSNGECYPHKMSRIPVAYLTASDENIIASPNMYRDGKVLDIILERKILDKNIKVEELCKGDRDAIVLWLRATGYGPDFPIVATHPDTKKQYPINVKLDTFKYYPFNLKGDENGYFEYITNNGDVIKFKYLSIKEENNIKERLIAQSTDYEKYYAIKYLSDLRSSINNLSLNETDLKELEDCMADMKDILNVEDIDFNTASMYEFAITNQMTEYTMSINGNDDKEYIKDYIENMRAKDAYDYRKYVNDNTPGVNMKINVSVPQSDGGGTFDTFLGIDDYVFANI